MRWSIFVVFSLVATAQAVDCGRLPKGENPKPPELNAEIMRLSANHNVPAEVIKAVAWQESGCQQWRANGTFVYNKKDCGLGMMQLTGATARQFEVERLKDDWKYNLECGVKVLVQKWKRAERKGQAPSDPAGRHILENWYYAIAYYWGGKTESYLKKIFGHMEKRPGRLQQLMSRGVKVTLASEAIPGFKFGDKFTAFPKNRFVDGKGKDHKAPTHLGTIGDPRTLAELDVLLTRGEKYAKKGKAKMARKYLLRIIEKGLDTPHKKKAEALLAPFVAQDEVALEKAKRKFAAGERGGKKALRDLARAWKGHPIGTAAEEALAEAKKRKKKR